MANKKILIATPLYPPDIGGPATYAFNLEKIWLEKGIDVSVINFGDVLKYPPIIRHFFFFLKICQKANGVKSILVLDTFSVCLPTVVAGLFLRKKIIVRVGGDFLWEKYINRTKSKIKLSYFYKYNNKFSFKEKIVFLITRFILKQAFLIVFSTNWLADIWKKPYKLDSSKFTVIQNSLSIKIPEVSHTKLSPVKKVFLTAGRNIFLKNIITLEKSFQIAQNIDSDIELKSLTNQSQDSLLAEIINSYAIIVPSFSEVSPNLVFEAISFKKPVLLTEDNGIKDVLGSSVIYINPFDVEGMAQNILLMSDHRVYEKCVDSMQKLNLSRSYSDVAVDFEKFLL